MRELELMLDGSLSRRLGVYKCTFCGRPIKYLEMCCDIEEED